MSKRIPPSCEVEGCEKPYYAKGYCNPHWQQQRAGKEPGYLWRQEKFGPICTLEDCERDHWLMGLCVTHYKRKTAGIENWNGSIADWIPNFGECTVPSCSELQFSKTMCKSHYRLKRKFKLSDERIAELYANPVCQICGTPEGSDSRMHSVDHDHSCCPPNSGCEKCVRGLLCGACNKGLGFFRDNATVLESAIKYLTRYNKQNV